MKDRERSMLNGVKQTARESRVRLMARWPHLSYLLLPLIIFMVMALVSTVAYGVARANLDTTRKKTVEKQLQDNSVQLQTSLRSYAQLLWSGVGLANSGEVSNDSWQKFMAIYDMPRTFPGMEAIGLVGQDKANLNRIAYITPDQSNTRHYVGLDMQSVPALKTAIDQATATGRTAISSQPIDVSSTLSPNAKPSAGFFMFAPFYDQSGTLTTPDERQAAARGYVVSMFRGDKLLGSLFSDGDMTHATIAVYLGTVAPDHLLYKAGATVNQSDVLHATDQVELYGQRFSFVYSFDTAYLQPFSQTYLPEFLLLGGLLIGVLFAVMSGVLLRGRFERLSYEKERDVEFAKDELLSLASHQLRTPATGVKQYMGMVLQGFAGTISPIQEELLTKAYKSNERQLHIINDILHLAKLDLGRIVLAKNNFDLADLVRDVVDEQNQDVQAGQLWLTTRIAKPSMVYADKHMLRMVIENVVSNAIKYTDPGGKVAINLRRTRSGYTIAVKDTGVGIARTDMSRLFTQFSRLANSRSHLVNGTGVGLYLAKHLMLLHGGDIRVKSVAGKGSTFTIIIPSSHTNV